jgi:hypothetical protein
VSVESPEDRLIFVDPDAFGETFEVRPRNGSAAFPLVGIFDDEHKNFDPNRWPGTDYQQQTGAKFSSDGPTIQCFDDDPRVKAVRQRDQVYRPADDKLYRVQDKHPDGTRFVILVLMEE